MARKETGRNAGKMQWTMECNIVDFQESNKKFKRNVERRKDLIVEREDYFTIGHLWSDITYAIPPENLK